MENCKNAERSCVYPCPVSTKIRSNANRHIKATQDVNVVMCVAVLWNFLGMQPTRSRGSVSPPRQVPFGRSCLMCLFGNFESLDGIHASEIAYTLEILKGFYSFFFFPFGFQELS